MNNEMKRDIATPVVSVCIPAYNAQKYIADAIDSILNQSYPAIEIIVVDDGSTDGTSEILHKYRDKIKIVSTENRGQSSAANTAYEIASGAYIKFMDADDVISSNFIQNQIIKINGQTDAVVSAGWGRFYENNLDTFALNEEKVWKDMKPIDWLVESLWEGPNMMQCALWLIPKEILKVSGLWDARLSLINDFEFFIRVLLASQQILFAEDAILFYRSGQKGSLSRQNSRKAYESAFLSTSLGVKYMLAAENSPRVRKVCADCFQLWKYEFYPRHLDLFEEAEKKIESLGGSDLQFYAGGLTKTLTNLLGWKATKRIKTWAIPFWLV
jgi:glycosyltransferase involved in cell wall biosynthesis